MISRYDYISIVFYFVFVITVGVVFSRRNRNTSDYFRGGGIMPWWMAGVSAWMASFSAWTFTGAAGEMYHNGPYTLLLYYSNIAAYLIIFLFTCYRFRRMRAVTPVEAIRSRYGATTQQFVTWLRLPFLLVFGGFGLNAVGVFMSGAFGVPMPHVIVALGVMVTFVSLVGGAFGVAASDFVQMFLVVTVTLVISAFALYQPSVGGFSGLLAKVPAADFHWGDIARPEFITLWFLALTCTNIFMYNTIEMSAKYLMAKSDSHARKMALFPLMGTLFGPLLWILPPMIASVTHPGGLGQILPTLKRPEEGAFLVTAHDVLPKGMLGLLVAGIFGATVSNLDASMNQAVGILVRNFYLPIINPKCPEKKLLIISKLCTALFGLLIIEAGLVISHQRSEGLFALLNQLGVGLWLPLAIPMCLGLFYKRTPAWSGWSTALVGLAASFGVMFLVKAQAVLNPTTPNAIVHFQMWVESHLHITLPTVAGVVGWIPGLASPLKTLEITQGRLVATAFSAITVGVIWYFFTSLFYEKSPAAYKANLEEFFARLKRPIEDLTAEQLKENHKVVGAIGMLCLIFGGFVVLMMLVPNPLAKRLGFLFSGSCFFIVGWLLRNDAKRHEPGRQENSDAGNISSST
jgi:solute:Na+ symporter, SSS family